MLYDPEDPNQALYKGNMQPIRDFKKIDVTASVRSKPISQTISDPRGISYKEYANIVDQAFIAFGYKGTRIEGTPK